jgi:hypothetical protein
MEVEAADSGAMVLPLAGSVAFAFPVLVYSGTWI